MARLLKAKIIKNDEVAPAHFLLGVESPEIAVEARAGQFAHISCKDEGIILRRPFSFYDREGEIVFFLYQVMGKGTSLLKKISKGEEISILGPLGRGFWYENNGRKKIIAAGGVGLAPFPLLIKEMIFTSRINPANIIFIYGAKKKERLAGVEGLKNFGISVYISTDDGEEGFKGTVSDLVLELIKKGRFEMGDYFTCGPEIMMKKITEIAGRYNSRAQVCLEERMACGVGACLSCVRKVGGRYLRVCKDGPIFWGDEVEW